MAERTLLQEFIEVKDAEFTLFAEEDERSSGFLGEFKGIAHNVGRITQNRTLYSRALMHREVERLQPLMAEGKVVGLADHPGWTSNEVLSLAVRWTKLFIDSKNDMRVVGGILKTNAGKEIKAAQEGGVRFAMSTRGWGSALVKKMDSTHPEFELNREAEGEDFLEIQDDFQLETPADIVLNPSSAGSWSDEKKKESLARLEAALTQLDPEEDPIMKIENVKTLRESVSADDFDKIVAELTEGMVPQADLDAAVQSAEDKVAEALADGAKVAEAVGQSEKLIAYVKANSEKLEACAEADFPLDSMDPAKAAAEQTEADKRIKALEDANKAAADKIATLEQTAANAAKALRENELTDALRVMVEEATRGGRWEEQLTADALADLSLAEDYDPADAEKVKAAETMIEDYLGAKRAKFEAIAGDTAPKPKGNSEVGDEQKTEAEEVEAARKDFAEDFPSLVPSIVNYENCQAAAHNNGQGDVFEACYGKKALEILPL